MPLPTQPPRTAESAYAQIVAMAANVLAMAKGTRYAISVGPVSTLHLASLFDCLRDAKDRGEGFASVPGIEEYAKSVMGADYSIMGSFAAVLDKGTAVTEWLIANLPNDGKGGIVARRFVEGGQTQMVEMTTQETAGLAPLLDDLIAVIEA